MTGPAPTLQIHQELPDNRCSEIVRFLYPDQAIECGKNSGGPCEYCGEGVCIRHSDTCEKGCVLHTGCLQDHKEETAHEIEVSRHA